MKKSSCILITLLICTLVSCNGSDSVNQTNPEGLPQNNPQSSTEENPDDQILNEDQAIEVLAQKLNNADLRFMPCDAILFEIGDAFCIRAFYDHDSHIETEGFYYVIKANGEIYKENLIDGGYMSI